jgi:hypothetical protein
LHFFSKIELIFLRYKKNGYGACEYVNFGKRLHRLSALAKTIWGQPSSFKLFYALAARVYPAREKATSAEPVKL